MLYKTFKDIIVDIIYPETNKKVEIELAEIEVEYSISNDGIGCYEYWGCKGIDRGTDGVDEFYITSATWPSGRRVSKKVLGMINDEELLEREHSSIMRSLRSMEPYSCDY